MQNAFETNLRLYFADAPGKSEMGNGFTLPEFILLKIKNQIEKQRVERESLNEPGEPDNCVEAIE